MDGTFVIFISMCLLAGITGEKPARRCCSRDIVPSCQCLQDEDLEVCQIEEHVPIIQVRGYCKCSILYHEVVSTLPPVVVNSERDTCSWHCKSGLCVSENGETTTNPTKTTTNITTSETTKTSETTTTTHRTSVKTTTGKTTLPTSTISTTSKKISNSTTTTETTTNGTTTSTATDATVYMIWSIISSSILILVLLIVACRKWKRYRHTHAYTEVPSSSPPHSIPLQFLTPSPSPRLAPLPRLPVLQPSPAENPTPLRLPTLILEEEDDEPIAKRTRSVTKSRKKLELD